MYLSMGSSRLQGISRHEEINTNKLNSAYQGTNKIILILLGAATFAPSRVKNNGAFFQFLKLGNIKS